MDHCGKNLVKCGVSLLVGHNRVLGRPAIFLVAGSGLEPEPGGYEPPEIPLLHPAVYCYRNIFINFVHKLELVWS